MGTLKSLLIVDFAVLAGWPVSRVALFLVLGAIAAGGLSHVSQPKKAPTPEKVSEALVGKWRAKGENGFDNIRTIIFEPDGEAWLITTAGKAVKSSFWLHAESQPMQIDILAGGGRAWMTTLDFETYGKLKLLPMQQGLQQMRHGGVETSGIEFSKQSGQIALDKKAEVTVPFLPSQVKHERHINQYMNTLIYAQRRYHKDTGNFATQLSMLNAGFTEQFMGYQFKAVLWNPGAKAGAEPRNVMVQALPTAADRHSYAALLATREGGGSYIHSCRSDQPSFEPPAFQNKTSRLYNCGEGASRPE